jgi:hypothetical protein
MLDKEFNKVFRGVNGPEHRGAPLPVFDKFAINEGKFADKFRFKEYDWAIDEDTNEMHFEWITQGCYYEQDEIYEFLTEISRCIQTACGFDGNVNVTIRSRDGEEYGFYKTVLTKKELA